MLHFFRFFMAMISYGYFGDLMAHSERLRWLGPKRYDVSGVHTFLGNRAYKGVIQFEEETNPDLTTDPKRLNDACYANCGHCERVGKASVNGSQSKSVVVSKVCLKEFGWPWNVFFVFCSFDVA
jgi:ceramide kinase